MSDEHERSAAYREGFAAGSDLDRQAIDCPYLATEAAARRDWMAGFGNARPAVSAASNPATARGIHPGEHGGSRPPLHEG